MERAAQRRHSISSSGSSSTNEPEAQLHKKESAMAVSRSLDTADDHAKAAELRFSALSQSDLADGVLPVNF